jgi:archaellum component FlaC
LNGDTQEEHGPAPAEPGNIEILGAVNALATSMQVQFGHVMVEISGVKADVAGLKNDVAELKSNVESNSIGIADLKLRVERNHHEAMTLGRDNRNALRGLKEDGARLDRKLMDHINDPDAHRRAA